MSKARLILLLFIFMPFLALCSVIDVDSANFFYHLAVQQKQLNKSFEADKHFRKAITMNPADNSIRLAYGDFLVEQRKVFAAIEQYAIAVQNDPNNIIALDKVVNSNFLAKRWPQVITFGERLLTKNTSVRLRYLLGKAYYEEEDYGLSQKYLKQAIQDSGDYTDAVIVLGQAYIELSNYDEALRMYLSALNKNKDDNKLIYQVGMLYYTRNEEKEAVKYFELAVEKGYKIDLDYKENLGMAYLSFDLKKGEEILQTVLAKKPNDVEIMTQIAQAYYKARDFQHAADAFYQIYQAYPDNSRALYMTGIAYQKKGDRQHGTSLCEKAIQMDPKLGELKHLQFSF